MFLVTTFIDIYGPLQISRHLSFILEFFCAGIFHVQCYILLFIVKCVSHVKISWLASTMKLV